MGSQLLITEKDVKVQEAKKKVLYGTGCFYELSKWLIVAILIICMVHFFIATIFIVDGLSMEPNFHTGEYIIVNRFQYIFGTPKRSDVVVLKFPGDPDHKKYIKRVIGLPGENVIIQNGQVYINGQKLDEKYLPAGLQTLPNVNRTLKDEDYFLLGDNRPNSSDSRVWGVAAKRYLIGRAWYIIYPFDNSGVVNEINY